MFRWNPSTRKVPQRKPSHEEPTRGLSLGLLESRTLLSAFTVDRLTDNNPASGGQGSDQVGDLRYCVTNAVDGDVITFGVTGIITLGGAFIATGCHLQ
jgi:hypothetical protein